MQVVQCITGGGGVLGGTISWEIFVRWQNFPLAKFRGVGGRWGACPGASRPVRPGQPGESGGRSYAHGPGGPCWSAAWVGGWCAPPGGAPVPLYATHSLRRGLHWGLPVYRAPFCPLPHRKKRMAQGHQKARLCQAIFFHICSSAHLHSVFFNTFIYHTICLTGDSDLDIFCTPLHSVTAVTSSSQ